ncbi:MAG: HlyD family efflux transporter periplasmic adaptor subunit [Treponema sp.]|nr:HlyD family efflux transporter periplasmic adaptor subunit [Treponema sp.]
MIDNKSFGNRKLLRKYIILLFLTIIIFLPCFFFCHLDEILIVDGEIRPDKVERSIKSLFSGVVSNVFYQNSQFINKGDLLFELNSSYEKQQLENLKELENLYQNEESELNKLLTLINESNNDLPPDAESIYSNAKCSVFISEYKRYKKNLKITKENYERNRLLCPQSVSKVELEGYENSYFQAQYSFLSWFENQKIQLREQYLEIIRNLQDCHIQIVEINRNISNSQILAPITGYINEVSKIKTGDYIYEGTDILTIIPESDNLKCKVLIPSSSISKIKIGQEAIVQITDLPWSKYGKVLGSVSLVPPDAIQILNSYPNNVFPVEIKLQQNYLQDREKEKVFLHIGSSAKVRIKISKNTIFQKFLQRLINNG